MLIENMNLYFLKLWKGGIIPRHDFVNNDFVLTQSLSMDQSFQPSGKWADNKIVKNAVQDFTLKLNTQPIICYTDGDFPTWYLMI